MADNNSQNNHIADAIHHLRIQVQKIREQDTLRDAQLQTLTNNLKENQTNLAKLQHKIRESLQRAQNLQQLAITKPPKPPDPYSSSLSVGVVAQQHVSRILTVSIHNPWYTITEEVLHCVFDPYGSNQILHIDPVGDSIKASIEFQSQANAMAAQNALQGRCIYNGCCQLSIELAAESTYADVQVQLAGLQAQLEKQPYPYINSINEQDDSCDESDSEEAPSLDNVAPVAKVFVKTTKGAYVEFGEDDQISDMIFDEMSKSDDNDSPTDEKMLQDDKAEELPNRLDIGGSSKCLSLEIVKLLHDPTPKEVPPDIASESTYPAEHKYVQDIATPVDVDSGSIKLHLGGTSHVFDELPERDGNDDENYHPEMYMSTFSELEEKQFYGHELFDKTPELDEVPLTMYYIIGKPLYDASDGITSVYEAAQTGFSEVEVQKSGVKVFDEYPVGVKLIYDNLLVDPFYASQVLDELLYKEDKHHVVAKQISYDDEDVYEGIVDMASNEEVGYEVNMVTEDFNATWNQLFDPGISKMELDVFVEMGSMCNPLTSILKMSRYDSTLNTNGVSTYEVEELNNDFKDQDSGKVLLMLGKVQFELQRCVIIDRSHISGKIILPSEYLLNELQIVEEMKAQCGAKRLVYEEALKKGIETGKHKSGKADCVSSQNLQADIEDYDQQVKSLLFCMRSMKQGQYHSFLTQPERHNVPQLSLFKKSYLSFEAIEPYVKSLSKVHHIDYEFRGLEDEQVVCDEYESDDDDHWFQKVEHAGNLDVIVKSANMAAEVVPQASQAGRVVARGKPLPLPSLIEADLAALGTKAALQCIREEMDAIIIEDNTIDAEILNLMVVIHEHFQTALGGLMGDLPTRLFELLEKIFLQNSAEIEEFILMPTVSNLTKVGDRLQHKELYEAAKVIFAFISNWGKSTIALLKLDQFQGDVDTARKAKMEVYNLEPDSDTLITNLLLVHGLCFGYKLKAHDLAMNMDLYNHPWDPGITYLGTSMLVVEGSVMALRTRPLRERECHEHDKDKSIIVHKDSHHYHSKDKVVIPIYEFSTIVVIFTFQVLMMSL